MIKQGEFIKIEYTGMVKETGMVFDTTDKETAEKEKLEDQGKGPVTIIAGAGYVIQGIDESLINHEIGDSYSINVPAEKGFGKRKKELVKLVPIKEFKKQNLTPYPGMSLMIDDLFAKVMSVSGGRVMVDFNHPLAGKQLTYQIKTFKKVNDLKAKIRAIIKFYAKKVPEISINGKEVKIKLSIHKYLKDRISNDISEYLGLKTVFI